MRFKDLIIAPTSEELERRKRESAESSSTTPTPTSRAASPSGRTPAFASHASSSPPPPVRSEPLLPLGIAPTATRSQQKAASASKEPDPKFTAKLRKDLAEKATTAGLEEFMTQLDVIDDDVADRRQAVSMTLKSLERVQKIGRQQVIASVRERLAVLENARVVFEEQIAEESQQATINRRQALQDTTSHVAELERQLEEAKRARSLAEQSVNELSNMVSEVRARFESAHEPLVSEFSRLLSEINQ